MKDDEIPVTIECYLCGELVSPELGCDGCEDPDCPQLEDGQ